MLKYQIKPPERPPRAPCPSSVHLSEQAWGQIRQRLGLTGRETQIVRGIFDDCTEKAVASDLGISRSTVHTHVERVHRKLRVVDRVALIQLVFKELFTLILSLESGLPPICPRYGAGLCAFRAPCRDGSR